MIDMHCHILPQLDDGPSQWSDSLAMAQSLADVGFTGVVATPHLMDGFVSFDKELLDKKVSALNNTCRAAGIPLTIYPGGELMASAKIMTEPHAFLPAINSSRYILLEIPLTQPLPLYLEELLFTLNARGFRTLLAHPERCYAFLKEPEKLMHLKKYELLYQVNLASFCGHFGPRSRRLAFRLLRTNMISFLGTDAHKAGDERISLVPAALKKIKKSVGAAMAERLLVKHPQLLLQNEPLALPPLQSSGHQKGAPLDFLKKILMRQVKL